jgi:Protein of unknown function (DUF1236)
VTTGRESERNRVTTGREIDRNRVTTGRETERNRVNETRDQNRTTEERRIPSTTGQGAAGNRGAASITEEQRTRLHSVFVGERSAPRVDHVDFDLGVGRPVPRTVHFVPVPEAVFAIEPAWRGYDYFMVGDQIVIVDPLSMEIVAILEV